MKNKKLHGEIIQIDEELNPIIDSAQNSCQKIADVAEQQTSLHSELNELAIAIDALAEQMGVPHEVHIQTYSSFSHLDVQIDELYRQNKNVVKRFPELSPIEWIFASIAGAISVAIDVVFVGTPEVVKIYKGGENFDGSKLTAILRNIGTDPESNTYAIFHWLSEKCKVPYDLSAVVDVMYPNNHRIRNLAHDPLFGLFFAIADIILGTTTCIDNSGSIRVLLGRHEASQQEKLFSVFYYIGHILSDICTSRGIPVPGFFLTQFFPGDGTYDSLAKKAEMMYFDGYDMRHLMSMAVPVVIKNLLIDAYLMLQNNDDMVANGIAEKEISKQQRMLKKEKMLFISDCVAIGGNLAKIFLPPSCGNPTSINLNQWAQFVGHSISMSTAATRDMSVEQVIEQRKGINQTWEQLLSEKNSIM